MQWVYLSPHFDDIALSCGGLVWEQAQQGHDILIWTICGGDPPPGPLSTFSQKLHERWQTSLMTVQQRRREDVASCKTMNANFHHLMLPDCIYRPGGDIGFYYDSEEAIFGELNPAESPLVDWLCQQIQNDIPEQAVLVSPLTIGGHVDHRLTRAAAERTGRSLWYYADYPYILNHSDQLETLLAKGWKKQTFPISPTGLDAWQQAIAAHTSQVSTFWPNLEAMAEAISWYSRQMAGVSLWQAP